MSKKIQLSVPKPCHENWEAMTPVEKGKFCGSCQKQVVDFSNMSDRQVAEFFKKPSTGSVCGRFMNDQLDREIAIPRKRIPFIKYFFQILIPALFLGKVSAQKMGKVAVRPIVKVDTTPVREWQTMGIIARPKEPECKKDSKDTTITEKPRRISGTVTDDRGNPLPSAAIAVKGSRVGVSADNSGHFRIYAKTGDLLVVSGMGLERKEVRVTKESILNIITVPVTWKNEVVVTMGAVIICDKPMVKPPNKPVQDVIPVIKENNSKNFKIFPNPLRPGEQLTIDYKRLSQGPYQMQWLDQSGQLIHEQPFNVESKSGSYRTTVPVIIAGSYFLVLTEKKTGKGFTEKIIIQ